jgi:hypothetical protein
MALQSSAILKFSPNPTKLNHGLSAVVQVGKSLWVANDETIGVERLLLQDSPVDGPYQYGEHHQFSLADYLELPVPPNKPDDFEEVDIEGLAYDSGYLWLVGSHSRVRKKLHIEDKKSAKENMKQLATVGIDGNRYLLARIPIDTEKYELQKEIEENGEKRTAAQLAGDQNNSELTTALKNDEHLKDYLSIPSKDNGFDIEGLAVAGKRVFVGLRGPVLRGFAVILELEMEVVNDYTLTLKKIGPDNRPYRKHFLQLHGLGIRDLCVQGDDLLILAGPTMELDGPATIYRWPGGAQPKEQSCILKDVLPIVMGVPYGNDEDHPEGLTLFNPTEGQSPAVLVVYDAASEARRHQPHEKYVLEADVFVLA